MEEKVKVRSPISPGNNNVSIDRRTAQVNLHQVIIAQWLVQRLATGEVPGSNPGKGDNL